MPTNCFSVSDHFLGLELKGLNHSPLEQISRKRICMKRNIKNICHTILKCVKEVYAGFSANIYLLKVNNRHTRKRCKICSKVNNKNTRTMSLMLPVFVHEKFLPSLEHYLWFIKTLLIAIFVCLMFKLGLYEFWKSDIELVANV